MTNSDSFASFDDIVGALSASLTAALPGPEAQHRMAPRPRREWPLAFDRNRIRRAAGLLLVFPVHGRAFVPLTVRAAGLRHGGQVSLPGGVIEPGETIEEAALREAHEEVSLAPTDVRVIGALTPLDIPISGFQLHPVVGVMPERPILSPADGEVDRILEVSVATLCDPARLVHTTRVREGLTIDVPAFAVGGHEIWGATAMVLAEFLTLLGWTGGGVSAARE